MNLFEFAVQNARQEFLHAACPHCGGTGSMVFNARGHVRTAAGRQPVSVIVDCKPCRGSGRIYKVKS